MPRVQERKHRPTLLALRILRGMPMKDKQTMCAVKQIEKQFLGITYWKQKTYIEEDFADEFLVILKKLKL